MVILPVNPNNQFFSLPGSIGKYEIRHLQSELREGWEIAIDGITIGSVFRWGGCLTKYEETFMTSTIHRFSCPRFEEPLDAVEWLIDLDQKVAQVFADAAPKNRFAIAA